MLLWLIYFAKIHIMIFFNQILPDCSVATFYLADLESLLFYCLNNAAVRPFLWLRDLTHLWIPSRILIFAEVKSAFILLQINPFQANVPIPYPWNFQKTFEKHWENWNQMGTLAWNGLTDYTYYFYDTQITC